MQNIYSGLGDDLWGMSLLLYMIHILYTFIIGKKLFSGNFNSKPK